MRRCQSSLITRPAAAAAALARGFIGSLSSARVASCHARQMSPPASFDSLRSASFEGPAHPAHTSASTMPAATPLLILDIAIPPENGDEVRRGYRPRAAESAARRWLLLVHRHQHVA